MSHLEGHRQRLQDRFDGSGLGAFEDHEVLELLLTYAIPRRDAKPIARGLLDRFGSLSVALDAKTADLVTVNGVGESASTLLHALSPLARRYVRDRYGHRPQMNTQQDPLLHPLATSEPHRATSLPFAPSAAKQQVRIQRIGVPVSTGVSSAEKSVCTSVSQQHGGR